MRIKCPNSDIVLELPGDRTDMKFTCPACHKVHRVTITITTPGEDPPPPTPTANTRSMTKASQQMPKKYATGAFAPVVDIPIDANFVLLDDSIIQSGIDLGQATVPPPPRFANDFSNRKTEIVGDHRDSARLKEDHRVDPPHPSADGFGPSRADSDETTRDENRSQGDDRNAPPPPPPPPTPPPVPEREKPAADPGRPAWREEAATRRRKGGGAVRNTLFVLLLAALGGGGYLGWQQVQYNRNRAKADNLLSYADTAWEHGEVKSSATLAQEAQEALRDGEQFNTPKKVYNMMAEGTGLYAPLPPNDSDLEQRIKGHLEREKALGSFRDALDTSSAHEMAALLGDSIPAAANDPALVTAMEKTVTTASLERLHGEAETNTPEEARNRAHADMRILSAVLSQPIRAEYENNIASFADSQRRRLDELAKSEISSIASAAKAGNGAAFERFRELSSRLAHADVPELAGPIADMGENADRETLRQLSRLSEIVDEANVSARTVLARAESDGENNDEDTVDGFITRARALGTPNVTMAETAIKHIEGTRVTEDDLLNLRVELFSRLQSEMRRNRDYPGTRMAWSMLRSAFDDPNIEVDPRGFRYDSTQARMEFRMSGIPAIMDMKQDDYEKQLRADFGGYAFQSGWAVLFHKPMTWMAGLAGAMRKAGVDAARHPNWELLEGPGAPLALSVPGTASSTALSSPAFPQDRYVFFDGRLMPVTELPHPDDARRMVDDFRQAAQRLEEAVMADPDISQSLRQALKPVLMGTYQAPDPRDYFDSSFCRRLIEADYLEAYIRPMPAPIQQCLDDYRDALGKLEAGYDEFSVQLDDGSRLFAVAQVDADITSTGRGSDQDPETGETIPRFTWRMEKDDSTVFFSPLPARFVYAFMLAEQYPGRHHTRPAGEPEKTEVWHATQGLVASYKNGAASAEGDSELWDQAIAEDSSGRFDPTIGPPGWNFPMHVLLRDDQGDPVRIATPAGTVDSPDFSGILDPDARRRAEDEWLDHTAETLSTPGELGLIFHQFFRYCSDSPLPEMPNLIGSHFGLSDTHQTVYQSLERRWVGRLIGDCDDLAEFFQVLTRRQGKLSHVMQLPGHAAAGYVEPEEEGYRFVVLQTGPVLQFTAPTLNEVVETAYRSFDRGDGISHMTTDAVPLLLRFADEETRTPFVLSARIYADAEYADTMIQVQAHWHEHVYSAAIKTMERMVAEDQEVGSIKELGSLYERVGFYDKSEKLRRQELDLVKDNVQASLSTLLEITQLHFQEKNKESALESLGEMEALMQKLIRQDDAPEFFRAMTFRSYWAMYLARLGQPDRAWTLVRYDVTMTKRQLGRMADPVLRTLVVLYDRMCMMRDAAGGYLYGEAKRAMDEVRKELEEAMARGYFKADDSYNNIISRYFVMGRYAVSDIGRENGLERLRIDGPYPTAPKDQIKRGRGIDDEDWEWFRITPQLYLALGMEMLDQDEYPELYDPAGAKPLLEDVFRAVQKGTGLGSDIAGSDDQVKAELTLSFLNNDLAAFRRAMANVKDKDYSSLYDDAAMTFGLNCGLIPVSQFGEWCDAFREFFPGSQHYFKVVYRAIDKEHYDHALVMTEATARFFPDKQLLLEEAEFVRSIIPGLKMRKQNRPYEFKPAA